MKVLWIGGAIALLLSSAAQAQNFTHETTWGEVAMTGGVGPKGQNAQAGTVSGNFRVTNDDGSIVTGQIMCIGMDQPPSSGIFALHMACDAKSATGNVSIAYGCNWVGEEGAEDRPLACVGALQGKGGDVAGRRGMITMYWSSDRKSTGVGQWFEQ